MRRDLPYIAVLILSSLLTWFSVSLYYQLKESRAIYKLVLDSGVKQYILIPYPEGMTKNLKWHPDGKGGVKNAELK